MRRGTMMGLMLWWMLITPGRASGAGVPWGDHPVAGSAPALGSSPVTVLLLPGVGPQGTALPGLGEATTFSVPEAGPVAAFVRLAGATGRHRLFAERVVELGKVAPATSIAPGVRLPFTGPDTQVWSPRLGPLRDPEPGRWVFRPSRAPRARLEVVPCPGEISWVRSGHHRPVLVRVSCDGAVRLTFEGAVGVPLSDGRVVPEPHPTLQHGRAETWVWEEGGRLWSVGLALLEARPGRVVWHREGPVPDGVFGPADAIALRDGHLDVVQQAGFIRGALRSLFVAVARRPAAWTLVMVHPLAELALALTQAPGSWEDTLRGELLTETLEFVRGRMAAGHRVALAGFGPVLPVDRLIPTELLERAGADQVVAGPASVLFLFDRPGPEARRRLERGLARLGLTPGAGFWLSRVPGGLRLDFPPGVGTGRCRRGEVSCAPPDLRGQWPSAPWLRGWTRTPLSSGPPPLGDLAELLPHLVRDRAAVKPPAPFNQ